MRLRFKIPLAGLIFIVLLIATALVLLYQSHILENLVNRFLAEQFASQYNLDITISEIDGSFVEGFVLRDVSLRYKEGVDTVTVAYLPRVNIAYKISNLWHRQWIVDSLSLYGPQLRFRRDTTGRWILPHLSRGTKIGVEGPSWAANRITIDSGTVELSLGDRQIIWYDITLRTSVKSDAGTYTLRLDTLMFNSSDGRLKIREGSGLATLFEKRLTLQNILLEADSTKAAFSLSVDGAYNNRAEIQLDSAHIHLQDIVSFLGSNLSGDLNLRGSLFHRGGVLGGDMLVSGTFENRDFDSLQARFNYVNRSLHLDTLDGTVLGGCLLSGSGEIDFAVRPEAYKLNAQLSHFDLSHLIENSFQSDLNGAVDLKGRGFRAHDMALDLIVRMGDSRFDIYHPHSAVGRMSVTHDSLLIMPGFTTTYYDNSFSFGGAIIYNGNLLISGTADLPNLDDFTHQTFIDLPAGRGTAEFLFSGLTKDPDLRGRFQSDSLWMYKFFSSGFDTRFDISRFTTRKLGTIELLSQKGDAWGFPIDSMYAELILDSNLLKIDSAVMGNAFSSSSAAGVLDYEAYPQSLRLDTMQINLTGRLFHSDGRQDIRIDSSGFLFDRVSFASSDGHLTFAGRANYDESLDLGWDVQRASLAPWIALYSDTLRLDARASSTGKIRGTLASPLFQMEARLDSMTFDNYFLGDLWAHLSYEDTTLFIDSSFLKSREGIYTARGEFPINLALDTLHPLFDERTQDIQFTAQDKEVGLAALFVPSVEYVTGDLSAEVNLTGQPMKPHLTGTCTLKDGIIKLVELRDRLENVACEIEMSDRLITITRAEATVQSSRAKNPGRISAGGTILINDINSFTFALNAQCHSMPIDYEMGEFAGLADAQLRVNGPTPPTVRGKITMPWATYRESFEEESGFSLLAALEGDKTWNLDLLVEFPSNFRVQNDDIDAEFTGDVNILRTAGVYNFLGNLEVIRGKMFMLDKTFTITPGGVITYDNIEEPDPNLGLEISTRIRTPRQYTDFESESDYSYELVLSVSGTLMNPIIAGGGETPLSSEEILPSLIADYHSSSDTARGDTRLTDRITVGGAGLLASQFSRLGTRSLGVETFEINPGYGKGLDAAGTQVTIGAYTLPNLYVFGSSYFDVARGQEVGVEFRLGRHYLFEGRRDENNLYHMNFKLHWEY